MKSLPNDAEIDKASQRNAFGQPVSFDRFVEAVTTELVTSNDLQTYQHILPSIVAALKTAYVSAAKRSPAVFALPIAKIVAAEVVSRGWIRATVSELNEWAINGRFYRIASHEALNGEYLFPVWQFVGPTPNLIQKTLPHFAGRSAAEIHAFWVCSSDELNELAPAELLAGIPFETREHIDQSQHRYLRQTAQDRLRRVINLAQR